MRKIYLAAVLYLCAMLTACRMPGELTELAEGFISGREAENETTRSKKSLKLQAELAKDVTVEAVEEAEDEYGTPVWKASVTMPDYSLVFALCREEAESGKAKSFEESLLELAGDYVKEAGKDEPGLELITREITMEASEDMSISKDADKIEALLANEAVEAELEEFAVDILMEYTLTTQFSGTETEEGETEEGERP